MWWQVLGAEERNAGVHWNILEFHADSWSVPLHKQQLEINMIKALFKCRILHAPNLIAELSACKMRRLNQLNATYFN